MSRTELWDQAAEAMRQDEDTRWHAVADWLRAESLCQQQMGPFAEIINAAVEQASGVKSYLRFGRTPDGNVKFVADTNEGATAVALCYLGQVAS